MGDGVEVALDLGDWFLTRGERGNAATSIDTRKGAERAWTSANLVEPLIHGRVYFARLLAALGRTKRGDMVLFTDWRGDPDERLDGPGTEVGDVLAGLAARGVHVRGLLWRSHSDRAHFSKQENRDLAVCINEAGGMAVLDERVRRAGSHHQKLVIVLDQEDANEDVAFVGGIDLCHGRNDDGAHRGDPQAIFLDPRFGPRPAWHDIQLEVHGPAIDDLVVSFVERWNDRVHPSHGWDHLRHWLPGRRSHRPPPQLDLAARTRLAAGPHAVQVLRTYPAKRPPYPFAPLGERSIAHAYVKAFRRARSLIYIEDQYLWSMDVADAIGRALAGQPALRVVVVVPRYPDRDGRLSGPPSRIGQVEAIAHLRRVGGPRFVALDLERDRLPVYVHAKVCIVDDVWMTIGSDNLNRRSWTHDSELSCAIIDESVDGRSPGDPGGLGDRARLLPRETRLALWREHLERQDVAIGVDDGVALLQQSARAVDAWHAGGCVGPRPIGRLRHHDPEPIGRVQRVLARAMYGLVNDPDGRPREARSLPVGSSTDG